MKPFKVGDRVIMIEYSPYVYTKEGSFGIITCLDPFTVYFTYVSVPCSNILNNTCVVHEIFVKHYPLTKLEKALK